MKSNNLLVAVGVCIVFSEMSTVAIGTAMGLIVLVVLNLLGEKS